MMSDVPYGAFLSRRRRLGGRRRRDGAAPAAAADHLHDRLPRPRRPARRARVRRRERRALIGTDHHETAMAETDFLDELARCVPRLEEPCGIPSAPAPAAALALRRRRREGGARRPGRRRAARRLRPPPGRRAAGPLSARLPALAAPAGAGSPARCRAPTAPAAPPTCSAAASDAERLLRLVEITDHASAHALCTGGAASEAAGRARSRSRGGVLADVAGPRPARAGALPRHAHVPAGRHPDLQRQDVDGRQPRAARAVPRPSS